MIVGARSGPKTSLEDLKKKPVVVEDMIVVDTTEDVIVVMIVVLTATATATATVTVGTTVGTTVTVGTIVMIEAATAVASEALKSDQETGNVQIVV